MPTILDHIMIAVLVLGVPAYSAVFSWPKMKRQSLEAAEPQARIRFYWGNFAFLWVLAAGGLAAWAYSKRPWTELGFAGTAGWRLYTTAGAAGLVAAAMTVQCVVLTRIQAGVTTALAELREASPFAPQTRREMVPFVCLSLTAGICEEILYRGFLIWYVSRFTGTTAGGLAAAVAISAIVFGVSHLYQGLQGGLRVGGLALVFGALYVVAESLWIVMVLHVYMDVVTGWLSLAVHRDRAGSDEDVGQ